MSIAIQGELGSFSHEAALKMNPQATILPCSLSAEVFAAVERGEVEGAVIPIENSLAGSVSEHFDLLLRHTVAIERESLLRIRHNLIALPGSTLGDIRRVSSHPVALAQCRRFFEEHSKITATPFYDTAGSVKQMMEAGDRSMAAIASAQAASQYGGEIVLSGIEDDPENYTRFFLIRRRDRLQPDAHPDKVSLAFAVENRPGTLVAALEVFASQGTNLIKLESRPVPGRPWEYVFYADYQLSDPEAADAPLKLLASHCSMVRELGRYRAAAGAV
ncbi:prephenate dehydratase [Paracidobacterium acidisoli]|uniref:prephenate dehydratase n=1 Tax=Paracidobacterium acidisoli TaxID=2303751 RepID=A0A372ITY8_9BACT|nr:prephenate dehydratase domain-containing protein [Paracidobacterium acidisoli]MBT9329846.1 prephenate dehydratase [Paracidobacterium acidisoli]